MARKKKQEESAPGSPAWMATFSDLMNLLLCFFVLLFSMSNVDSEKLEALLASLSGNFSVFTSGSSMVGNDMYVASGASTMVKISDYFQEMTDTGGQDGLKQNNSAEENEDKSQTDPKQNINSSESEKIDEKLKEQVEQELAEEQKEKTEQLYEEVSQQVELKQLESGVTVEKDEQNMFVQISIGGAVLFDSAKADLKKEAMPIMSKVGDILGLYENHIVKIEGHTDNVPVTGGTYASNMQLSMARAESVFNYLEKVKKINPVTLEPSGRGEFCPVAKNTSSEGRARNRRVEFKIYTDEIK